MSESVPPAFGAYQPTEAAHSTADLLAWEFNPAVVESLDKGGRSFSYVPVSEVIVRLNKVLGLGRWSFGIVESIREDEFVVVRGRLDYIHVEGLTGHVEAFGGQKLNRTKAGAIIDLGDDYKGASSDSLKKCAQHLGVGLYLSRSAAALRYEAEKKKKAS